MKNERNEARLEELYAERAAIKKRMLDMTGGGVQSYQIGRRQLSRYDIPYTALIKRLEEIDREIALIEGRYKPRKVYAVVPNDFR